MDRWEKAGLTLRSTGGGVRGHFETPPAPWWARPMNSQATRTELTKRIIQDLRIAQIIETGTFLGTTTRFFAQFGIPVATVEANPEFAANAREALKPFPNVHLHIGNSVKMLRKLARDPTRLRPATLFYLDAHWDEHLPLREEVGLALSRFPNCVLLIDDFAVPDDPGYGFDDYGPGKRLDIEYLMRADPAPTSIFFPSTPSSQETGARRGCVVATRNDDMSRALSSIPMLRKLQV